MEKARADREQALAELRIELETAAIEAEAKAATREAELQNAIDQQYQELRKLHQAQSREKRADALAARALLRRVMLDWSLAAAVHKSERYVVVHLPIDAT